MCIGLPFARQRGLACKVLLNAGSSVRTCLIETDVRFSLKSDSFEELKMRVNKMFCASISPAFRDNFGNYCNYLTY